MDETKRFYNTVKWRTKKSPARPATLGTDLLRLMENRIEPGHNRFEPVEEKWRQLLPAHIREHCKLKELSGGILKVAVDSPSYMHQIRMRKVELVRELKKHCRAARIKDIKISL